MQHDDVIWSCINRGFCSFKVKMEQNTYCRNKYNITGLCRRTSCPLANSRYCTVLDDPKTGKIYLVMKTIERAAFPSRLWEYVPLPDNRKQAKEFIQEQLLFWPKFLRVNAVRRFRRIKQVHSTMRKLALKEETADMVEIDHRKEEKRLRGKERKALRRAQVRSVIEKELLERLNRGEYPQSNFPLDVWEKLMESHGEADAEPEAVDIDPNELEDAEAEGAGDARKREREVEEEDEESEDEFVEAFEGFDMEDMGGEDDDEAEQTARRQFQRFLRSKRGRREIEHEDEDEGVTTTTTSH
eukprot:gnl/Trimastix_PCT/2198.p1 GENE.gnl/Trimastix_PCT/2198~~gnl/Trimastix_PCT/2198.p1  ORF type:complete len:299 (+),score=121.85 gnl/Trimastix_PCT/2198:71-967(+)